MKNQKAWITAVLLVLLVLAGMASAAAEVSTWADLQQAIHAAGDGDMITLSRDLTASANDGMLFIPQGKTLTLDLNGCTLSRGLTALNSSSGSVIYVAKGAVLTVTDSSEDASGQITGGYAATGGGVYNRGTLILEAGTIASNHAQSDGGGINNPGTLIMNGGTLAINESGGKAGGVHNTGTFTMNGGLITVNTASGGDGGGVYTTGTFNMTGGDIVGNNAAASGGGVQINSGAMTVTGGRIKGNQAKSHHGGGIYVGVNCTLNLYGCEITENIAGMQGGGILVNANAAKVNIQGAPVVSRNTVGSENNNIYLRPDTVLTVTGELADEAAMGITMETGTGVFTEGYGTYSTASPSESFFCDGAGIVGFYDNEVWTSSSEWAVLQHRLDDASNGGTVQLTGNVTAGTADGSLIIAAGSSVTLDLNGCTVDRGLTQAQANGPVIIVEEGASLTVCDKSSDQTGTITGGFEETNGGGILNRGTLRLQGGDIMNNNAGYWGGGVFNIGTLIMTGGKVSYNQAADGAGIYNVGTMTMSGGDVFCNTASADGGGVYTTGTLEMTGGSVTGNTAEYSAGGIRLNGGTTTLSGGVISNNTATNNHGGGIYAGGGCVLNLYGGEITGNTAADQGGGILVSADAYSVNVQEKPLVHGNTAAKGKNIYIRPGKVLTVTGELSEEAVLPVYLENYGEFTSGFSTFNSETDVSIFFSGEDNNKVEFSWGEAVILPQYIARGWTGNELISNVRTLTDFTLVNSGTTAMNAGRYMVNQNVTINGRVSISGTVLLILADDCTLNCPDGISIPSGSRLNIYGQSMGTGKLIARASEHNAAIGSNDKTTPGMLEIHGGQIDAAGGSGAAGIGSGYCANGGVVNIYGGSIKAVGGENGAGIGCGDPDILWGGSAPKNGGDISIYGGHVEAQGGSKGAGIGGGTCCLSGNIYINGEDTYVKANGGERAAGIGRGDVAFEDDDAVITIKGGEVHATGGTYGAGIGGGIYGVNPTINISGGTVYAEGGRAAAGIGTGSRCQPVISNDYVNISGGHVTAKGGRAEDAHYDVDKLRAGAGIGGGTYSGCNVLISGGTIIAEGGRGIDSMHGGPGIGTSGTTEEHISYVNGITIKITGCTALTATGLDGGAGIGGGYKCSSPGLNISGGSSILAQGNNGGAGIGSGYNGTVHEPFKISGGDITAWGYNGGAGIGGGMKGDFEARLLIEGGNIEAWGRGAPCGAGIGSGYDGLVGAYLAIKNGAVVNAKSTGAAGIGAGGDNGVFDWTVDIANANVTATAGGSGSAIGPGRRDLGCSGRITISADSTLHLIAPDGLMIGSAVEKDTTLNLDDHLYVKTADGNVQADERVDTLGTFCHEAWVGVCDHSGVPEWTCISNSAHIGECPHCKADTTEEHIYDEDGICVKCGFDSAAWLRLQGMINAAEDGAVITVPKNLTAMGEQTTLTVPAGKNITIDLQGYTLNRGLTAQAEGGSVITVSEGAALTLSDSVGGGRITGGYAENGGGIYNLGTLTLNGVAIAENHAGSIGGGIYNSGTVVMTSTDVALNTSDGKAGGVYNEGQMTVNSCNITVNTAASGDGGGVYSTGTFEMTGGGITGNTASASAGGLRVYGGEATLNNVSVKGNKATTYHGGGIFVSDSGVLNLNGGEVTENTAAMQGGGILMHASAGTVGVQGAASVYRNSAASGSNIYLRPNKVLTVTGALADGARLHITLEKGAGVVTSGLGDNGTVKNFVSDSDSYVCGITAEGEARMDVPVTVTFDPNGGSGTQEQASVALNTLLTLPESTLTPPQGDTTFIGWLTGPEGTITAAGGTVLISAEETVICAAWGYDMGTPDFVLPTGTETIEAGAFEGIAAANIYIPDGCTDIGEGAFKNCPNLKAVRVPADCAFAEGDNPFAGCPDGLYIFSTGDALADFCSANGYHLVIESE